jgi:hypothetical protein
MKISYVCLIYKSVKWLKFVYEQFHKHTKLNEGDEFFFVANDACPEVLDYLKNNNINHYIHNNTEEQRKEWYINNVYRAWNKGGRMAKGDYVIFINSDMAFSKEWNINLINKIADNKCINSRLIERGPPNGLSTMRGGHGIEKNFGNNYNDYNEKEFLKMAEQIKSKKLIEKGLYMPMIIKKKHLEYINYYPEGNITMNSFNKLLQCDKNAIKEFKYIYATQDDVYKKGFGCVPGDKVLIYNLSKIGVYHYTAMDSIVYHFQQGEMSE